MTEEELEKKVATSVGTELASMHGGCFNPDDDPGGECADHTCYCSRMCERVARAAIAAMKEAGAVFPAVTGPEPDVKTLSQEETAAAVFSVLNHPTRI